VAYFRTTVRSERAERAALQISTIDDLALWINGRLNSFIPRGDVAWFDFASNSAHKGQRTAVYLKAGDNEIVFRVRGGVYSSGGFFVRLERP